MVVLPGGVMFMMWAAFLLGEEGENQENCDESSNSQQIRQILKLCEADLNSSSKAMPSNSVEFHCVTTGTQNRGHIYLCWNSCWKEKFMCSLALQCVGNHNAFPNQPWATTLSEIWDSYGRILRHGQTSAVPLAHSVVPYELGQTSRRMGSRRLENDTEV